MIPAALRINGRIGGIVRKACLATEAKSVARKGFGSFHSEDIETLIMDNRKIPDLLKSVHEKVLSTTHARILHTSMGKSARDNLFVLDKQWEFLNHGAFGAVMEPLLHASQLLRYECERQPLKFFDRELFSLVAYALQVMAHFVSCPAAELYPLQNVTSGLNCVLQSIALKPGDEVICFSLTYGSTKKMLKDVCDRSGANLCIVPLTLPVHSDETVVTALTKNLSSKTRLVIIDHITSNTALVLPTIQLAAAARQAGALVVVDAAHALFSQPVSIYPSKGHSGNNTSNTTDTTSTTADEHNNALSISDVADVWLTNGHKWLSAPKGCAFMWVHPNVAPHLRPAIISHGFQSYLDAAKTDSSTCSDARDSVETHSEDRLHSVRWWHESVDSKTNRTPQSTVRSKLLSSLVWDGCRDYTALLCTPLALQIWDRLPVGIDSTRALQGTVSNKLVRTDSNSIQLCRAHNRTLLHSMAVPMLMQKWQLREQDFAAPRSMRVDSPMVLVPLPERLRGWSTREHMEDKHAFAIQEELHHEHHIEVPVKCLEGRLYVRLSAHIYNTIDQYEHLASVISAMK